MKLSNWVMTVGLLILIVSCGTARPQYEPLPVIVYQTIEVVVVATPTPQPVNVWPPADDWRPAEGIQVVGYSLNTVERYRTMIDQAAQETGVDANLITIVMMVSSCGNPNRASWDGRYGLMGVRETAGIDLFDAAANIQEGSEWLAVMRAQSNDIGLAFAGYHAPGVMVRSWDAWPNETKRFYWATTALYVGIQSQDGGAAAREWLSWAQVCQ